MDHPFTKSVSSIEKVKRLQQAVSPGDIVGVLINADPDSMAGALALRRILWRHVKQTLIYHTNLIERADNLAFISLLKIEQEHIKHVRRSIINKWAIVDSQPDHHKEFMDYPFEIIIDHHPVSMMSSAAFVDIKEDYGATSTIMTEYLRAAGIKPSAKLATALFYGIKTDTDNFARDSLPNDINAFKYLYKLANLNIIKKIEASELTRKTLSKFRLAIDNLSFLKNKAYIHMGKVDNPDVLVIIADFFMKLAEADWSIVSGQCNEDLIVIIRNVSFRGDAGKLARKFFEHLGGSGGGHHGAARAEIPLAKIRNEITGRSDLQHFLKRRLREII